MDTDRETNLRPEPCDPTHFADAPTGVDTSPFVPEPEPRTLESKRAEGGLLEWRPSPGRVVAGHYRLLRSLGHGGMGTVWLAEIAGGKGLVAVKWLRFDLADDVELRARFRREIKAALAIRHEGIVEAVDLGRLPDGRDVLVMDYVDGPTLGSILVERGRVSYREALHIGRQIASALAAAHAQGFVHRDLKPNNLVLVDDSPLDAVRVKLLDLGICRDERSPVGLALTGEGTVLGTPAYTAPEQLSGSPVSHRADLYSLGVLLYRLVAGQTPFPGSTFGEVLTAVFEKEPRPLATVAPDPRRPLRFDDLVHRMLSVEPEDRPATAAEVARELDGLANPTPRRVRFVLLSLAASLAGALLGFLVARS